MQLTTWPPILAMSADVRREAISLVASGASLILQGRYACPAEGLGSMQMAWCTVRNSLEVDRFTQTRPDLQRLTMLNLPVDEIALESTL